MSKRSRWAIVAAGFAVLIGLVALYVFNASLTAERSPKTWTVQPGEDLTLSADEVHPDDRYRCEGKGGVNGTPEPGHGVNSGGDFDVQTDLEGTVYVTCAPGPPGNV